jgi:AcrR family transcriptional regulator
MPRTQTDARARILAIADDLFYRVGIRATGVDTLIARSEVAKTTFYRYFPAKDDLVIAYLEERNRQFWVLLEEALVQSPQDPQQQLLSIFTFIDRLLASDRNCGCPFLMVASEFPDPSYVGHQVAIAHKTQLSDRLVEIARLGGIKQAQELSLGLMLLVDGAFAQRRLYPSHQVKLQPIAARLIQAYTATETEKIHSARELD